MPGHDGGEQQQSGLAVVVLAEDDGASFALQKPKVLYEAGGRSLLNHAVRAASELEGLRDIFVVASAHAEEVRTACAVSGVQFIENAASGEILSALKHLREALASHAHVLVMPGDLPLLSSQTLERLWNTHQSTQAAMTLLAPASQAGGTQAPMVRIFTSAALLAHLGAAEQPKPSEDEATVEIPSELRFGARVETVRAANEDELRSVNSLADLADMDAAIRKVTAHRLMDAGVTIFQPETSVIDADVEVAAGTTLEPFVQLLGATRMGARCRVRSFSVIENCTVGDEVIIRQSCVLAESTIAAGADIGPFARMRPGCEIGEQVHIGNFVELKKARLHKGVKAGHLAYLGDTEIGAKSNIGAGVITCNYDGIAKHRTGIGENVFVGSDSTLVAPVTIGDGAYIGAGSCITHAVPSDALAVGRAHQVNKEGWAAARRARKKQS